MSAAKKATSNRAPWRPSSAAMPGRRFAGAGRLEEAYVAAHRHDGLHGVEPPADRREQRPLNHLGVVEVEPCELAPQLENVEHAAKQVGLPEAAEQDGRRDRDARLRQVVEGL